MAFPATVNVVVVKYTRFGAYLQCLHHEVIRGISTPPPMTVPPLTLTIPVTHTPGGEMHCGNNVSCQGHNVMTPIRAWTQTSWSRIEHTNHEATRPPAINLCLNLIWYYLGWIDSVPCPEVWGRLLDWKSWIWHTTISMKSHYQGTFLLWVSGIHLYE